MYNQFVQGNAELLSISSGDSIWNSDSDNDEDDDDDDGGGGETEKGRRVRQDFLENGSDDRNTNLLTEPRIVDVILNYCVPQERLMLRTPVRRMAVFYYFPTPPRETSLMKRPR